MDDARHAEDEMNNVTVNQKLAIARVRVTNKAPYFASALMRLSYVPRENLGTLGVTDKLVLLYDPEKIMEWTTDELAGVLVHELGHVLRLHHQRFQKYGQHLSKKRLKVSALSEVETMSVAQLWNLAGDAEINDDHYAGGWIFPAETDPVMPDTIGCEPGKTAEFYFQHLLDQAEIIESGDGCDGNEDGSSGGIARGHCGSCAGHALDDEPEDGHPANKSQSEFNEIAKETARQIQKHAESKGRGSVPGGWLRWADDQIKPAKVRWQDKLSRCLRHSVQRAAGVRNYSYHRPSRRQGGIGFGENLPILPAMHGYRPDVLIAIDTSGSMAADELTLALGETNGIIRAVGGDVSFVAIDTKVHEFKRVKSINDIKQHLVGGGGTDFRPLFEAAGKSRKRPQVIVFLTDGDGYAPHEKPAWCDVIWGIVGKYGVKPWSPKGGHIDWGEMIEIKD